MDLILLAVAGIVWAVIKAATQPPPKRPAPRPVTPERRSANVSPPPAEPPISDPYVAEQQQTELTLEVEELDDASQRFELTAEGVVQGVIMAEVLGPPRAKNPHKPRRKIL